MDAAAAKRVSTDEAMRRLAQKQVAPAYKGPRGNPEPDPQAMEYELRRLEAILA
ncbi:MAG: hypothetical protein ACJ77Z_11350 [Thermoleophilaceae bacterium]|jgi:hypothetical protein